MSCELALQQYAAAMDGTEQDFYKVKHLFSTIFHSKLIWITRDGSSINFNQVKEIHKSKAILGSKATLVDFREIGSDCVSVKYHVVNELEDLIIHVILTIEDDKIIKSEVVEGISIAKVWGVDNYRIRWKMMLEDDKDNLHEQQQR